MMMASQDLVPTKKAKGEVKNCKSIAGALAGPPPSTAAYSYLIEDSLALFGLTHRGFPLAQNPLLRMFRRNWP